MKSGRVKGGPALPVVDATGRRKRSSMAQPVVSVSASRGIIGGASEPIEVIGINDITANGGQYSLVGGPPIPMIYKSDRGKKGGPSLPVYPVDMQGNYDWVFSQELQGRRDFYVDATLGNDANTGRTPDDPWQTIGKINGETFIANDRILFKRGETWTGTALAPPRDSLTFLAYDSGAAPIIDGNDIVDCITATTKNNLVFRNIEATQGLDFGFAFSDCDNVSVIDCDGHDCGNDALLFINGCSNCSVSGGEFYDGYQRVGGTVVTGIEIADGCFDIAIDGVTCYGSAIHGMSIHAHSGETLPWNIEIKNSAFNTNTEFGISILALDGSSAPANPDITIKDCTINANILTGISIQKTGAAAYPSAVTIDGVEVTGVPANVYVVTLRGADHIVQRNLFSSDNRGVFLDVFSDSVFYNNTIYVPNGVAFVPALVFTATDNSGTIIKNNIISTFSAGNLCIQVTDGGHAGLTIDYNLYYTPSGVGGNRWMWRAVNSTWANWLTNSSQDGNSPVPADPLFVNHAGGDFTLQAGSPAINAGIDVGLPFSGVAPDCGAFERE